MPANQGPQDSWSQFAMSIFDVNNLLMRAGEEISQPLGQSSAHWQILGRIGHQGQTVASMARNMGRARQGVQRIADILVHDGLAAWVEHPMDQRTKILELTPHGAYVLDSIYRRQLEWQAGVLKRLDATDLQELTRALKDMARVLEEEIRM